MRKARIPKVLYVVCSTPGNPHSNGTVEVFTSRQKAERANRWGDQRLVEFFPRQTSSKDDVRALELADDIMGLQRQIEKLENPNEKIGDRNALRSLMSQQAVAAPTVARWVQSKQRGK